MMKPGDKVVYFFEGHHEFLTYVGEPVPRVGGHSIVARAVYDPKICGAFQGGNLLVLTRHLREFAQGKRAA